MKPKLSILTPTIPGRADQLAAFQSKINKQIFAASATQIKAEHLILCDNRARSIGEKRQALVDIALGDYIAFVDDDDDVSADYVKSLLAAIESNADVITFEQEAKYNGLASKVIFGVNSPDGPFNPGGVTVRGPWHVCAWKREKIQGCLFLANNYGEDHAWCLQARQRIKTATHIPKVLHYYTHSAETTAAPEL